MNASLLAVLHDAERLLAASTERARRRHAARFADVCRFLAAMPANCDPIPPTNHQRMIKRPDRLSGDQASDLHLLGSGGGI
jgi:hypothetical protein